MSASLGREQPHIPIRPRFAQKSFNPSFQPQADPQRQHRPEPSVNAQRQWADDSNLFGGMKDQPEDFDLFEVEPDLIDNMNDTNTQKKPYDMMIIVMAVVIIVLIVIVIWLMLSSKDEPVPESIVQPQYMQPPPQMGYPRMQQQPQFMPPMAQPQVQPQAQPSMAQPQMAQPTAPPPVPPRPQKAEMDEFYQQLKQDAAKNKKLPMEKYTITDSRKANQESTLETIAEEADDEDEDNEGYDESDTQYNQDYDVQFTRGEE